MTNFSTQKRWREEKYHVMYYSQKHYNLLRAAMRDDYSYDNIIELIEDALKQQPTTGSMTNSCQHMWGYFKKIATFDEKERYRILLEQKQFDLLLEFLYMLAQKYHVTYLLESRIFKKQHRL